jgi:hypothetical protein
MADAQVIINQAGPLPITVTADIESDGQSVLTLAGSVWSATADRMIGVTLFVDGKPTMISASIFSNGPSQHRAVVPVTVPYTFTIGKHKFALQPLSSATVSDANDSFCLTVQY